MSALANVIREFIDNNDKGIHGQNELADAAGIRRSTLSNIMTNENTIPRPDTVKKLAAAMGVEGVVLTALLGYPVQAEHDPDGKYILLARQLEAFPWLVRRFDDFLKLSEARFLEAMDYLDHRRLRAADRSNQSDL